MDLPNNLLSFDGVNDDNNPQENRDEDSSSSHDDSYIGLTIIEGAHLMADTIRQGWDVRKIVTAVTITLAGMNLVAPS